MPDRKVPIEVAVIGAGNMGRNHVRTYKKLAGANIVALADINPAAKEIADEHGIRFYADYKAMLDEEKLQAVSLVVPTPLHHKIGLDVMSRNINVLIEKPIASNEKEADELIAYAKKKRLVFTVGHIERYNPIIRKLKKMIDEKKLGKVTSIVCKRVGGFPNVEPKTDVIIDLAVHDIDIISYLLGSQPKKIHEHGSRTHHSNKIDSSEILLDYGHASGFIQANWLTPVKIRTIAVTGSKGYVEGNYITQRLAYYEHNMRRVKNSFESFVTTLGEPNKQQIKISIEEPLSVELKSFIAKINGEKPELVDPKDAKNALKIAQKAITKHEGTV